MLRPDDMVRVKRTLAWLAAGSVLLVVMAGGLVWALGAGEGSGGEAAPSEAAVEGQPEGGEIQRPESEAPGPAADEGEQGEPGAEADAPVRNAEGASSGWAEEYDHKLTGDVVNTDPAAYDQTDEGQLVMRFFAVLARAEKVNGEWVLPMADLREILEISDEDWPFVMDNLSVFRRTVMERGPWEQIGVPVPGVIHARQTNSGREVYGREVFVLVRSDGSGGGEQYYQVLLDADFVRYLDGRLVLSQRLTRISEVTRIAPDDLNDYLAAHGVR